MASTRIANAMLESGCKRMPVSSFAQASASTPISMPSRQRFNVVLKPGETTFVSWKKLLNEFQETIGPLFHSSDGPVCAHSPFMAHITPEKTEGKPHLRPPANRLNAVIEKIERLYQGGSSDEEICEVMDRDKYDIEDSFIDDTELNDYFSEENVRLKHSGFFVNKGKLEREEQSATQTVGPKKRKSKNLKTLSSSRKGEEIAKKGKSAVSARCDSSQTSGAQEKIVKEGESALRLRRGPSQTSSSGEEIINEGKSGVRLRCGPSQTSGSGEGILKEGKSSVRLTCGPSQTSSSGTIAKEAILQPQWKKKGRRSVAWKMDKGKAIEVVEKELNAAMVALTDITGSKSEAKHLVESVVADRIALDPLQSSKCGKKSSMLLIDLNEPPPEEDMVI
ncbi:hypothetical protein KP509_30G063800 [Ceratopteris richardii]|uniref:Hpc2-related domain-containing protein n=1 Tax=Ceratopteris richardii TaxID=49495 RepID=A0A8T2R5C7_CERRI|nr:hypothetical protein KP509_30G063800 [Ceratopteris richardii]